MAPGDSFETESRTFPPHGVCFHGNGDRPRTPRQLARVGLTSLPEVFTAPGEAATKRFVEFFTANIRNPNTRVAYSRAVTGFFEWCERRGIGLSQVQPMLVAAYIEPLPPAAGQPSHGQAAPGGCSHVVRLVRGPKHVVKKGSTTVLTAAEARQLLDAIPTGTIAGLRDRALIGVMVYSFARVSAVLKMNCPDYYPERTKWWFALREKGGKRHAVSAHHNAAEYVDAYLTAAGLDTTDPANKRTPLFQRLGRNRKLNSNRLDRTEVYRMVTRRAKQAGLATKICCHTFRATGITAYLDNGGTIEKAQQIAAHESPRTTKLYDRTNDQVSLDEIEKVVI